MIVVTDVYQTCASFPSQWEARTADGRRIYVRFRGGDFRIGMGDSDEEAIRAGGNVFHEGCEADSGSLGEMPYAEMCRRTAHVIQWPEREQTYHEAKAWNEDARETADYMAFATPPKPEDGE